MKVAFVFPGQGSQAIGMGKSFYEGSSEAKALIDVAGERIGVDMTKLLFEEEEKLGQTEFTQPAILLVSMVAHRLFSKQSGIKPALALGHSLGEFSALVSVGAIDMLDAVELVHLRGKLMKEACADKEPGMLVVLGLDDEPVEAVCEAARNEGKQVWPANYNTPGQLVVAGIKSDLESIIDTLKDKGAKRAMLLNMSTASHCPLLESAVKPLEEALQKSLKESFGAPVVSNVTAKPYDNKEEALALLPKQLTSPVLYKQSIAAIDDEVDAYIEFGHGSVLKGIHRKLTKTPHYNVSDIQSLQQAIEALQG